jgi:hypothetical protein
VIDRLMLLLAVAEPLALPGCARGIIPSPVENRLMV